MKKRKKSSYSAELQTLHKANRALRQSDVIESLEGEVVKNVKIVGKWLWATFPQKPDRDTREYLYALGFYYNPKRQAWQHPCGHDKTGRAKGYDPRDKYGVKSVEEEQQKEKAA